MAKLRGKRLLLEFDGVAYDAEVKAIELVAEEGSVTSGDLYHTLWMMNGTADINFETGEIWDYIWENTGEQVLFRAAPHGNATASATQPHFSGTVEIGRKPNVAWSPHEYQEFEFSWEIIGDVTKETSGSI